MLFMYICIVADMTCIIQFAVMQSVFLFIKARVHKPLIKANSFANITFIIKLS